MVHRLLASGKPSAASQETSDPKDSLLSTQSPRSNSTTQLRAAILAQETAESREKITRLLATLNAGNLAKIVELFNDLPRDGRQFEFAFSRLMQNWASFDGAGAFAFGLSAAHDPELRDEFYFAVGPALERWAEIDLSAASMTLAGLAPDFPEKDRNRFAIYLMEAFARQDADAGMKWIEALGLRSDVSEFVAQCSLALARSLTAAGEEKAAREWLQAQAIEDIGTEAIGWMATHIALQNPANAWQWLSGIPCETAGRDGIQTMMTQIGMDQATLQFWTDGFVEGRSFDSLVEEYARDICPRHPPAALAWARLIEDPDLREQTMSQMLNQWRKTDPAAARSWPRETLDDY